jgi:hypothetical protein
MNSSFFFAFVKFIFIIFFLDLENNNGIINAIPSEINVNEFENLVSNRFYENIEILFENVSF